VKIVFAKEANGNATGWTSMAFWLLLNLSTHALSRSPRPASLKVTAAKVMTSFVWATAVTETLADTSPVATSAQNKNTLQDCRFMNSS
jgi:hypothetical protein